MTTQAPRIGRGPEDSSKQVPVNRKAMFNEPAANVEIKQVSDSKDQVLAKSNQADSAKKQVKEAAGLKRLKKKLEVNHVDDDEPKKKKHKLNNGNAGQGVARWFYHRCSAARSAMETPVTPLQLAIKVLKFVKSMDKDADEVNQLELFNVLRDRKAKRCDLSFVFEIGERAVELRDDEGLTEEALRRHCENSWIYKWSNVN